MTKLIKLHICFFIFLNAVVIKAQRISSSCSAKDSILNLYRNDADRLAIRNTHLTNSSYEDSVRIDKELSEHYLNALIAVWNATSLAATDTVTRLLNIHSYNPGLNSLVIKADSNLRWMVNIRHNEESCGDLTLDYLINRYHLSKVFYSSLFQPALVVFKSDTNCNLLPLAKIIKRLQGVGSAECEYLFGDGNDITDKRYGDFTMLEFSYAWEACTTGCQKRRYWKFSVSNDCFVLYLGSYGDALEPVLTMNVEENGQLFENVKVYPNPAKEKLYIELAKAKKQNLSINLVNAKGDILRSIVKPGEREEIDMILLANGIYYLKLQANSLQKKYKIYKGQ